VSGSVRNFGHTDSGHHDRTPLKHPVEPEGDRGDGRLIPVTTTGPH